MPFTNSQSLNLFLSYASEDQEIAEAISKTLKAAFFDAIEITIMSEFSSGLQWREIIHNSIDKTDILLAIATGRLRPAQSFTGYEIGSFAFSLRTRPFMTNFPTVRRRMIPFAILDRVPDAVNDFQGIDIDPSTLHDVRFDASNLEKELDDLSKKANAASDAVFKLLSDIQDIIVECGIASDRITSIKLKDSDNRSKQLHWLAQELCAIIFESVSRREREVIFPKSILVISTKPHIDAEYDLLDNAEIHVHGPCFESFGIKAGQNVSNWESFTQNVLEDDIRYTWKKAISNIILSREEEKFIDNCIILSFDRKKLFRLLVSRITTFYSGKVEYRIAVIELLRRRDYGDPETTVLLKALEIGLAYRFMFLEGASEFSPAAMRASTRPSDFQKKILEMINNLNILLQHAEEAHLSDGSVVVSILGPEVDFDDMFLKWEAAKSELYEAAQNVLLRDLTKELKNIFIEKLTSFCESTNEMNKGYVASVMNGLRSKISPI